MSESARLLSCHRTTIVAWCKHVGGERYWIDGWTSRERDRQQYGGAFFFPGREMDLLLGAAPAPPRNVPAPASLRLCGPNP